MSEHIDYDCSGLLQREKNLDQTGDELIEVMLRTCNGRLTCAEALGPPRVRADAALRVGLTADAKDECGTWKDDRQPIPSVPLPSFPRR